MRKETNVFWIVTASTIGWMVVMHTYSPKNIIQFELAGTIQTATEIISNWKADGVALAKTSTYLDFIFLVLYCGTISLGCKVASNFSRRKTLQKIGLPLSRIVWLAGICDAIENIAMLRTLQEINQLTISIAWCFATVKFIILVAALLFVITSTTAGLFRNSTVGTEG
jgi:hypothetical protein